MRTLLLLALLTLYGVRALAESDSYPTGLDLLKRCYAIDQPSRSSQPPDAETLQDYGYCLGFVVGYLSGFAARDAVGEQAAFCPPDNATIADFVRAVQAWLVEHPEGLEQLGAYVTAQAFQSKFPCGKR